MYEYETLTNEDITNLMNYGTLEGPQQEAQPKEELSMSVDNVMDTTADEMPEVPEAPKSVDKKDLDDAFNELTKRKE